MIYLVTTQTQLFESEYYKILTIEESLEKINSWDVIQFDTETNGKDPHIKSLLCAQFGNDKADERIVVDCSTVSILHYKKPLETKLLIGQNLKFDLQFLYNYNIIPLQVYDLMIVEQLLYLGYPAYTTSGISYSLAAIAKRYLGINIDKTVRGEIIWRGLDTSVILYGAGDVTYLQRIRDLQLEECKKRFCLIGAQLENDFVPVIAYLEWCGVKLDQDKWKQKMASDKQNLDNSLKALNDFVLKTPSLKKFTYVELQGDLFAGFNTTPIVNINWSSSKQVIEIVKILGFSVATKDKKTGEDKESVLEKFLSAQKGINDEFLNLYFKYQEYSKLVSSFGQSHLNLVNPITGRLYTSWKQLGASSGRMSCGSDQSNDELATLKKLPKGSCPYVNLQQLPKDSFTRSCFIAEPGNLWVSCDWSAAEARLAGDIYNDQAVKDIFLQGIDSHSMYAKIFFKDLLKNVDVHDVKKQRPDLRQLAKGPE